MKMMGVVAAVVATSTLTALGCGARTEIAASASSCDDQACPAAPVGMHNTCSDVDGGACLAVCDDGLSPCDGGCCSTVQLSLSSYLSCALKGDGSVWCWKVIREGQTGTHTNWVRTDPELVDFGASATKVNVSGPICVERSDGIFCRPITSESNFDSDIGDLLAWKPRDVHYTLVLTEIVTAGLSDDGQLDWSVYWPEKDDFAHSQGPWSTAKFGVGYTCGLDANRSVRCFGLDQSVGNSLYSGILGGPLFAAPDDPVEIGGFSAMPIALSGGGNPFACVLTALGGVQCWGSNENFELGTGKWLPELPSSTKPVDVLSLGPGAHVIRISSGGDKSCAIKDDRSVWCWGDFTLCPHDHDPFPVPQFGKVSSVQEDLEHVCAVLLGGGVACFDWGEDNQMSCLPDIEPYLVPGL